MIIVTDINLWVCLVPEETITMAKWPRGVWDRKHFKEGAHHLNELSCTVLSCSQYKGHLHLHGAGDHEVAMD